MAILILKKKNITLCMKLINRILQLFKAIIENPLSLLRFSLSILLGKKLVGYLQYLGELANNAQYELSKTWFTNLLPELLIDYDAHILQNLKLIVIIFALSASIGFLGRLSLLILAFLSFYILGLIEGIGSFDHHLSLSCQVIFALSLVPGSMRLSMDFLLLKFYKRLKKKYVAFNKTPKWSINLILLLVALTYFSAGISKLRYGNGIKWLDGSTLSFYLKEQTLKYDEGDMQLIIGDSKITDKKKWKDSYGFIAHTYANFQSSKKMNVIANYIASNKFLVVILSIGSVMLELLCFIVFINSKYRNIYLISAIIFHSSIGALMGISFRQYRLICFCLIDWNYLINVLKTYVKKIKLKQIPYFTR